MGGPRRDFPGRNPLWARSRFRYSVRGKLKSAARSSTPGDRSDRCRIMCRAVNKAMLSAGRAGAGSFVAAGVSTRPRARPLTLVKVSLSPGRHFVLYERVASHVFLLRSAIAVRPGHEAHRQRRGAETTWDQLPQRRARRMKKVTKECPFTSTTRDRRKGAGARRVASRAKSRWMRQQARGTRS
jgi:hypothetical protein